MRARLRAREQVIIESFRPASKGGGQISEFNGTLKNLGNRDVKDVEITCEYQGGSGTVLDRKVQTVYENIAAGKSIPVRGLIMGLVADQSKTVSCVVSDVKLR
ncbi:FxLYD domain-containing protein [Methylobacterium cerastii]|uniref:FxLYD domain-containing protein n=1 Tax=Methylobacterium cerastii TaxID=932741 RepID=UPI001EE22D0D|nr:FxLYD domain-containing protein [Methylobacterium cerastii]